MSFKLMSNADTLDTTNVAQLLGTTHTFESPVSEIAVLSDKDAWLAPEVGKAEIPGAGTDGGRVFVKTGVQMTFKWRGQDVFFVNAVGVETPLVNVTGYGTTV